MSTENTQEIEREGDNWTEEQKKRLKQAACEMHKDGEIIRSRFSLTKGQPGTGGAHTSVCACMCVCVCMR